MGISVVIPAYNEQANIRETVTRCHAALSRLFNESEIILVNDCSTDDTGRIADELARQLPQIRVLHNPRNLRQGASLVAGLQAATQEFVTHNAMDYPFHLEDLAEVMPLFDQADIVVVARNRRPESTLYRRLLTSLNLLLLRNCFGLRLRDYNFVQVYRRTVLQRMEFPARSTGFLTPSLLFQAHRQGCRIREIELDYWPREQGAARSGHPKVLLETLQDMARFWWNQRCRTHGRGGKMQ
jgi:glycosyltransferase involved in cell wall biosynthesis